MLSAVLWPNDLTPLIPGAFASLVFESYLEKPKDSTLVPDAASHKSSWQLRMESVQLTLASGPALHIKDQRQQQYILGPGQDVSLVCPPPSTNQCQKDCTDREEPVDNPPVHGPWWQQPGTNTFLVSGKPGKSPMLCSHLVLHHNLAELLSFLGTAAFSWRYGHDKTKWLMRN